MNKTINLNADLGESFGPWQMGNDAALLQIVGSANIACGIFQMSLVSLVHRTVSPCLSENLR